MRERSHLPMLGVAEQPLRRCALAASLTHVVNGGKDSAAAQLFQKVRERLRSRSADASYSEALDRLQPAVLARELVPRLAAMPELSDPGLDLAEQARRAAAITAIRSKAPSRSRRDAVAAVQASLDEAVEALRGAMEQAFATAPEAIRPATEQVRQALAAIRTPLPDADAAPNLQRIVQAAEQIRARQSSLTASSLEIVQAILANQGRQAVDRARAAMAQELVLEELPTALRRLQGILDELAGRGARVAGQLAAVQAALEQAQRRSAEAAAATSASASLRIDGPDETRVLAGLRGRAGAPDLAALAEHLLGQWEARLRDEARQGCPDVNAATASLAALLAALPAATLATSFLAAVEGAAGEGTSFYELVRQRGIAEVATFLYERAEPLVQLGGRDMEQLNIYATALTLVRLPPTTSPQDAKVCEQLQIEFRRLDRDCHLAEGGPAERDLAVIRLYQGWPIGIEQNNTALLERYERSADLGHRPHLLGVLADSPDGGASPAVLALFDADPDNLTAPAGPDQPSPP